MREKVIVLLFAALVLGGCASINGHAKVVKPDGTQYELEQDVTVLWGAELEEGALKFGGEFVGSDGSNWNVTSGTQAQGVTTPDITPTIQAVIAALERAYQSRMEMEAAKPPPPDYSAALLELLNRTTPTQ